MGALWALSWGGGVSSIKATHMPRLWESPCLPRGRQQGRGNQGASGSHRNPKRKPRGSKEQVHVLFLATNNGKLLPEWCKFCLITLRPFPGGPGERGISAALSEVERKDTEKGETRWARKGGLCEPPVPPAQMAGSRGASCCKSLHLHWLAGGRVPIRANPRTGAVTAGRHGAVPSEGPEFRCRLCCIGT